MKLYELAEVYNNVIDLDLPEEELTTALQNIDEEIEIKADNIGKVLRELEGQIETIKAEEKRLQEKRKSIENKEENLKKYLKDQMEILDKKKIKTDLFSFSVSRNRTSVKILDETKIPEEYFKITRTANKTEILKAYQEGKLTEGIELEQTESLRIR